MANAREIPGTSALSESQDTKSYAVEVTQGRRGALEAKFRGRSFTFERECHPHYRWRCAVEACSSRLDTVLVTDEHSLRKFKGHDEVEHQKMNSEDSEKNARKRRNDAVYRNQPVHKIGGFRYVLEKASENLLYWRCEYVTCPGRCRTDRRLRIEAGPSHHLQELHADMDQRPSEAFRGPEHPSQSPLPLARSQGAEGVCDVAETSTATQLGRTITDQGMSADFKGCTQEASWQVRMDHHQEQRKNENKRKLPNEEAQRGEGPEEQQRGHRLDSPVKSSPPVLKRHKHLKHNNDCHDPVRKQSVIDLTDGEPRVSPVRLMKQEQSSPPHEASAPTLNICDSRSCTDDQKTRQSATGQTGSAGWSLATGGSLHRLESPLKESVDSVSPRKHCEVPSTVKREQEIEPSSDCKDASEFESDDDRSTVSMEADDTNLAEKSTLGLEAAGNSGAKATDRCAPMKAEDEGRNAAGNYETPSHMRAGSERNESPSKTEHKLSHATAKCGENAAGEINGSTPETSASHEGETTNKADDKRSHKSAHNLLAEMSPERSASHRGRSVELPRVSGVSYDSRERELRAALLIQTRRLLEVETQLVNEERRNEAMRRMLLTGIVSKAEPSVPFT